MSTVGQPCDAKQTWRRMLLERRDSSTETTRSADNERLGEHILKWVARQGINTIGAYVPVGSEPGSLDLLNGLRDLGARVLLPIVVARNPLDWAEYSGPDSLVPATYGLLEPAGERLGPEAISAADAVLVPALAVDQRGVRLGRGAGYYDRSLLLASAEASLLGMIRDDEFVPELPGESHDVRVGAVVTAERGVLRLPV